jgi:hypothetical protein
MAVKRCASLHKNNKTLSDGLQLLSIITSYWQAGLEKIQHVIEKPLMTGNWWNSKCTWVIQSYCTKSKPQQRNMMPCNFLSQYKENIPIFCDNKRYSGQKAQ